MFRFSRFAIKHYEFMLNFLVLTPRQFPDSDILGSKLTSSSPRLFAGSHVLHRLLSPRHPPIALSLFMFSNILSLIVVFHNIHQTVKDQKFSGGPRWT